MPSKAIFIRFPLEVRSRTRTRVNPPYECEGKEREGVVSWDGRSRARICAATGKQKKKPASRPQQNWEKVKEEDYGTRTRTHPSTKQEDYPSNDKEQ